ncbi:MAG: hypothetical protein LQ342_002277 [Letrouitia transgressa]|nr:MAG: hypothetical protein LQ342_002277 [Letrouitia transgressa]
MESPNTTATLVRPPPPGVTPNFNHFSSAVNAVFIAAGICGFVVVLLAVMRLYTKICLRPKWAVSDYFALLGMAWAVGYIPLIASVFNQGQFGHHSWDVLVAKLSNKQYLLVLLAEVLYGPVLFIIKMSLLLVYREVWRYSPSWMRQCSMAGIIVFGLFYLAMTAAEIALCAPRSGEDYILALSSPRCQRTKALAICSGVFNIISDTYLLALPIKPTWDIHGPISKRLSITVVFMSGIIAWVAGILGLYYRIKLLESNDVLWDLTPLFISIIVELTAGIFVLGASSINAILHDHCACYRKWLNPPRRFVQTAQPAQKDPANEPSSVNLTQQKTDSVCSDTIRRLIDDYTRSRTFEMLSWEAKQDDSQVPPACQSELAAVHFA